MFFAALTSALSVYAQATQRKRAWLSRLSCARCPHAEQRWLVNAGLTFSTLPGALSSRRRASRPQLALGTLTSPQWRLSLRTSRWVRWTIRNPLSRLALRQRGRRCVPAKKFAIACLWSRTACCCTITLPAASHGLPVRALVSCRQRSAKPGTFSRPGRHHDSCSTHRFHTYRASAQCRSRISSCPADNSRRYLDIRIF